MAGYLENHVPGPLSGTIVESGGDLRLWEQAPSELVVLEVPPVPLGENDIFGHDFDPAGRWVDYAAGFVALAAANVKVHAASGNANQVKPVEISLKAAIADPDLVIPMIRGARLTDFHEMIIGADVSAFHERFAQYYREGKEGLWDSLALTRDEIGLARSLGVMNKWRTIRDSKTLINHMREMDEAKIGSARAISGFKPSQNVLNYILDVDRGFVGAQFASETGDNSVSGSPMTRQRLERLMAVKYASAIRSREGTRRPADIGLDVTLALIDQPDAMQQVEVDDPELLKLIGLRTTLDALWTEQDRRKREARTLDHEADPDTSLNPEILEMEALHAALEAEIVLALPSRQIREAGLLRLVSTIAGMEELQTGHKPDRTTGDTRRLLRLDLDDYAEADFQRDILLAGTVWRIINQLQDTRGVAVFEKTVGARIRETVERRVGQAAGEVTVRAVIPQKSKLAIATEHYDHLAAEALSTMGLDGPIGVTDGQLQNWYKFLLASAAARRTDNDGRYEEARRQFLQALGDERKLEDFPGQGRMFCFYGDTRREDGDLGILEAIATTNGAFLHLESAGNDQNNPMASGANRAGLKAMAKRFGFQLEVHEPSRTIPDNYLCEAAHFLGRLPNFFTPNHILSTLIPNGYATVSVESNRALVERIRQEGASVAQFSAVPTQIVRFNRNTNGLLDYSLGHNHPNWIWPEHTLIIFRDKEDGTPSDLYDAFKRQAKRAA